MFYSRHFHEVALDELVTIDLAGKQDTMALAKQEYMLRAAMKKAASKMPVISITALTDTEKNELRSKIHDAFSTVKGDTEVTQAFENAFKEKVQAFGHELAQERPAFLFIQEDDWKWFIPLLGDTLQLQVINQDRVGRRKLLLVANPSGSKLMEQKQLSVLKVH